MTTKNARKWYQDPLLIAAIQFEQEHDESFLAPPILDRAKFDTEQLLHVFGKEVIGLYIKERDEERVRRYISMSPDRNIILYANAHIVSKETFAAHDNWAQRTADGNAAPGYTNEIMICMNSPWRDYFFDRLREMLELPIKGIFLDGPSIIGGGCFCPDCQRLFLAQYGHPLSEATRRELRNFKSACATRFIHDVRTIIHETRPDVILYANSPGLSENVTGGDVDEIYNEVDFIGSEGGFLFYGDPNNVSLYKTSNTARYLEAKSGGKPYVVFCAGNHQPWARYMMTPEENELLAAATVSNGANLWYGIHGSIHDFETKSGEAALSLIRELAENKEYYTDTRRRADVAVLWSKESIHAFPEAVEETDFTTKERHGISRFGSAQKEFDGVCEILARNQLTYAILDEKNLREDDLSAYPLLILPNAVCLDDAAAEKICAYVNAGGNVIATLCTGMCDELGNPRATGALAELFGIQSSTLLNYDAGCGYLSMNDPAFAEQMTSNPTAGFAGSVLRAQFADDCTVLASMHEALPGRYSMLPSSTYPSVIERRVGRGRVIYLSGALGATFAQYGVADFKTLLPLMVTRMIAPSIRVANAFETVEVNVREQEARTLVHFINYTAAMRRPLEHTIPCQGMQVSLRVSHPVTRVLSMRTGREIAFTTQGDEVSFSFDVNGVYDVAVIE